MARALVIDSDPYARNVVRMILERFGFGVTCHAGHAQLASRAAALPYDVVVLEVQRPNDHGDRLAQDLRARGWCGMLILTTGSMGTLDLPYLKNVLRPAAIFAKPLDPAEARLRLEKVLPTQSDDTLDDGGAWDGALRVERKQFARGLSRRVDAVAAAFDEARASLREEPIRRAADLAAALAADAARFRLPAVADLCNELSAGLDVLVASGQWTDPMVWRELHALLDLLEVAPTDRVLAERTIDDDRLVRHELTALFVHPDLSVLMAAASFAERHRVGLVSARSREEAKRALRDRRFDVAFVADDLPDHGTVLFLADLRGEPGHAALPVALVGGHPPERHDVEALFARARASAVNLPLPLEEVAFVQALGNLTRRRLDRRRRVVLVEPDEAAARRAAAMLEIEGVDVVAVDDVSGPVQELLDGHRPDLVMSDVFGPTLSGLDLCRRIRALPHWAELPVVLTAQEVPDDLRDAAVRVGADDVLPRDLDRARLLTVLFARMERWRTSSRLDPELGVLRRGAVLEALRERLATLGQASRSVAVALVKVCGLREINEAHGIATGDAVLRNAGRMLRAAFGVNADVGRWNGPVFAVVLPGETWTSAAVLVARAGERLESLWHVAIHGKERFRIQVRTSVASSERVGQDADQLVAAAEARLRDLTDLSGRTTHSA